MYSSLKIKLARELAEIKEAGLYKTERIIVTPQDAIIQLEDGREVINFCANNYLGLSSHPKVIAAAQAAIDSHGFGMSSVRFICGTQDIHKELEMKISYCTPQLLMQMAVFLSLFWGLRTLLYLMN